MEFRGRTALVTGAATGIRRSLAVALAREGAHLALLDVDAENALGTAELVRAQGRRAECHRADVSQREKLERAIDAAWNAQGPIALTCANAGVLAGGPLVEMDSRDIEWLLRVNLFGVLDTVRATVALARSARSGGHLLLTGSDSSVAVPHAFRRAGVGMYGITKHGVLHMADVLRYELAADGIGVSLLLPGPVHTEIPRSARKRPAHLGGPGEPRAPIPRCSTRRSRCRPASRRTPPRASR